jgi:small conductance mechanosensitive channel
LAELDIVLLLIEAGGIIAVSWLVGELLTKAITRVARKAGASRDVLRFVRPVFSIVWITFAVVGVLTLTGLTSLFSVLTLSGIAGLTVSLALQTTLSNIISGLFLLYDGALRLDDVVSYSGVRGSVVKIAFRNTWVKMDNGNVAIISNSSLVAGPLINETAAERLAKRHQL